jgi:hypothetical protein
MGAEVDHATTTRQRRAQNWFKNFLTRRVDRRQFGMHCLDLNLVGQAPGIHEADAGAIQFRLQLWCNAAR